jgi:hypothetical protein
VRGPGNVTLRATFKGGKKRKQACFATKRTQAAGALTLHCSLSEVAAKRLKRQALRLKLILTISLADGEKETIVQSIRLARD